MVYLNQSATQTEEQTMELTNESDKCRIVRSVTVADGPALPRPYSSAGKLFRVENITVHYVLDEDFWTAHRWAIAVRGPELKKDGSDSKNVYDGVPPSRWDKDPQWGFLRSVIDALRPTGTVGLPTV
jgi:hypothetical protein